MGYGAGTGLRKHACVMILALALVWTGLQAARAEPIVVAALGDSLTQGFGLAPEDGFVPQLEQWLRTEGYDVKIVNAGVSGDTTAGGLARIGWTLTPDVDALIVALGGNDLLRGLSPAAARENLDGILREAAARGVPVLLIGVVAPTNYGPDYKAAFDAIYPDLAKAYGALMVPDFLRGLGADGTTGGAAVRDYLQSDGLHPNAEGVARIVADLGPEVARLIDRAAE